jgi:hypothetical protein
VDRTHDQLPPEAANPNEPALKPLADLFVAASRKVRALVRGSHQNRR